MDSVVRLAAEDAGELLTLQRAAIVTEAQAHGDLHLPPLTQSFTDLAEELSRAGFPRLSFDWSCSPANTAPETFGFTADSDTGKLIGRKRPVGMR